MASARKGKQKRRASAADSVVPGIALKTPQENIPEQSQPAQPVLSQHDDGSSWLAGGGEMGAMMCAFHWESTPLGPISGWPQTLCTAVNICINSRFPMLIWWGPDLVLLYNDACSPLIGGKHPGALGSRGRDVFPEVWDMVGPMFKDVTTTGRATWSENVLLPMVRSNYVEEAYFTWSYSPIYTDRGRVGGIFTAVEETTQRVLGERRLRTLRDLGAQTSQARTAEEACKIAARTLEENTLDVPFALIYLLDETKTKAHLGACASLEPGGLAAPLEVDLLAPEAEASPWALATVFATGKAERAEQLQTRIGVLPAGPWPEAVSSALILPLATPGNTREQAGALITGISSRRILDAEYGTFIDLVAGHVATAITNARAYEAQRHRTEALAELDRAKTVFFSNVSHEFRTPLTLMLGPMEDLLAKPQGAIVPEQREQVAIMHRNGLRLLKLVNSLLDFSRIEAGRVRSNYEPTDLAALTSDLASVFRSAIERAGLRLIVNCHPLSQPAYVDREMWEKIVLNLLSNALKFTLEGEIEVTLRQVGHTAELLVRDTGTGIPPEELPHIFERFHRVQGARARTHEGTGIGLALVQELVKLHCGSLTVQSEYGKGCTFSVSIPLGTDHLPEQKVGRAGATSTVAMNAMPYVEEALRWSLDDVQTAPREQASAGLDDAAGVSRDQQKDVSRSSNRILLADDNADMRDYVRRLLSERYEVETVPDGEAALASARACPPALVLTDVMMPRLDGFGLLRELRRDSTLKSIPVIMLSARAGEESRVEGLDAGADDYLIKPFSARELMARVTSNLELARMRHVAGEHERQLRAEAEVAKAKVETILASISDGFCTVDREWRFIYVNEKMAAMARKSKSDLLGKNVWESFPELLNTSAFTELSRAMEQSIPVHFEIYFSPYACWFEDRAYPSQEGLSIFITDITERKQIQDALRDSENQLRQAQSAAQVGTWEWDPVSNANRMSVELHEIFGTEPNDPQHAEQWGARVYAADRPKLKAEMEAGQRSGDMEFEYRYQHPLRGLRWFYCKGRRLSQDDARMFGVVLDITERKQKEELLAFQANVLAQVKDVVVTVDHQQRITHWNRSAELLYGYDAAEVLGRPLKDVTRYEWVRPEDEKASFASLAAAGFWQGENIHVKKNKDRIYVESSVSVIKGSNGGGDGLLAVMRDITERKRAEEGLRQAHAELEVRVQERTVELSKTIAALKSEALERSSAEQALRESERRLHSIMDSSPSIVFIKDTQGRYVYVNDQFQKQLPHVPREQMLGKTAGEIFPAGLAELLIANDDTVFQSGAPVQFERVVQLAEGLQVGLVTKFPLRDTQGNVYALCGFVTDITERKRAEERLLASEHRFRSVTQSANDAVIIGDVKGNIQSWNRGAQVIFGYAEGEVMGKPLALLMPERFRKDHQHGMERFAQTGESQIMGQTLEMFGLRKNGVEFPLELSLSHWKAGEETLFTGIIRDVSKRKEAERALQESEARLRALVESMDDIVFEIDAQGRYLSVWTSNERLLARPRSELIGQPLDGVIAQEWAPSFKGIFERVLKTGQTETIDYSLDLPEGKHWFSGRVSPIRTEDGSFRTVCLLVRDITEGRRLEDALKESELRFRTTFKDLEVGVAVVGRGTDALMFNEAALELLGLTPEQLTGLSAFDPLWKIIHEDGSPIRGEEHPSARAIATKKPVRNVVAGVYRPAYRDYRWLLCNALPRLAADGSVAEVICSFSDITTQKQAQQAHQASEARLRALVESMDDIAFEIDENGTYLNIWTANQRLLPRPKEEMIGGKVGDFFGPDFARPFVGVFERVLMTGKPESVEFELDVREGHRWFLGRVSPIRSEEAIYKTVCLLVRDITDRKIAEDAQAERARAAALGLEIGASINEGSSLRSALQGCAEVLVRHLGAAFTRIWTLNPATNVLELEASAGMYTHLDGPHSRVPVGQFKIGLIAQERLPHLNNDVPNDPRVSDRDWARREGMVGFAGYPLVVGDRAIGVIAAFSRKRFEPSALQSFAEVADTLAQFIERKQAQDSLRELSGRLLHVQDEERRRMARELHDSTAQAFTALSLNLAAALQGIEAAEQPRVAKALTESLALADQACREIRTFSYLLHPPLLDEAGLTHALRYYVDGFAERTNIKVYLEVTTEPGRLSRDKEMAIFRVVQECLTNIHRHSGSPKAEIHLRQVESAINLEVRDYGSGIPVSPHGNIQGVPVTLGVGIRGMRERLRQLGGQLEVTPGDPGTVVRAVVPLGGKEE